jgi:hypothetical protein
MVPNPLGPQSLWSFLENGSGWRAALALRFPRLSRRRLSHSLSPDVALLAFFVSRDFVTP